MVDPNLNAIVKQLRTRQRLLCAVRWSVGGLLIGGMVSLVLTAMLAVSRFDALFADIVWSWLGFPLGGVVGFACGWMRAVHVLPLLRAADRVSDSEDRLASAWQLANHHRSARVELIAADALERAGDVSPANALPLRVPRTLAWLPLIAVAIVGVLWWGQRSTAIADDTKPRLAPEQWNRLQTDFENDWKKELKKFDDEHRRKLAKELNKLGESLTQTQEKRTALLKLAELRSKFESRRNRLKSRDIHLRQAAAASLKSSEMLKKMAELLKRGDYKKAAQELKSLSKLLRLMKLQPNAEELESVAKDFERLAKELQLHKELNSACRNCASAAQALNQQDLAKSLQDLAERLQKETDDLQQSDALSDACDSLNRLQEELAGMKPCPVCKGKNSGQCSNCSGSGKGQGQGQGQGQGRGKGSGGSKFVRRSGSGNRPGRGQGRKGGLKAGQGSAKNWFGGKLSGNAESRQLTQNSDREGAGRFEKAGKTVSAKEKAQSALAWKKKFLKTVQKAEADLELERVPLAYRNYLRRYFKAIQPKDDDPPAKKQ